MTSVQRAEIIFTDTFWYSLGKLMPKGNIHHHISWTQNICWNFKSPFHILPYNLFTYFFLSKSNWDTTIDERQFLHMLTAKEQGQYEFILQSFLQCFSSAGITAEIEAQDLPANAMPTADSSIFDRKQPWLRLFTEKVTHIIYSTSYKCSSSNSREHGKLSKA